MSAGCRGKLHRPAFLEEYRDLKENLLHQKQSCTAVSLAGPPAPASTFRQAYRGVKDVFKVRVHRDFRDGLPLLNASSSADSRFAPGA